MRRRSSLLLALLGLGAIVQTQPSAALTPYDYPWCALRNDRGGAQFCTYASYARCMESLRGVGGTCVYNLYLIRGPRYRGTDTY